MKIVVNNGFADIYTPYNADFVDKIKRIGGRRWNGENRCWTVPETEIDTVRQFMVDVYGESDLPDSSEYVDVRITFENDAYSDYRSGIVMFGKTIARAWGRDSGAKVGDDVTIETGVCTSGGSRANWYTAIKADTVIKIRNLPKKALEKGCDYDVTIEVIKENGINKEALLAEKEKLVLRLSEIEKLLAS